MTPNDLITRFRRRYSQCDQTTALELLNDVDEEILFFVPWRKSTRLVPVILGRTHSLLDESEIRVWEVRYLTSPSPGEAVPLTESHLKDLSREFPNWRNAPPGTPKYFAIETTDSGQLITVPAPNQTTLTVVAASNATPIVVTTQVHRLTDGALVEIEAVLGNEAANGSFYVKASGFTATTFALYEDAELTQPVAGGGAYASGGVICASGSPCLQIDVTKRLSYTGTEELPLTPMLRDLYVDAMCKQFAKERDKSNYPYWEQVFSKRLADQQLMDTSRVAGIHPEIGSKARQKRAWR